ncbi:unnamed protein product, partial [marine sediment metagenome]
TDLISKQMEKIIMMLEALLQLSQQEQSLQQEPRYYHEFLQQWHFTAAQQQQLKNHLRKFEILHQQHNPYGFCETQTSTKGVLTFLSNKLDAAEF